MTLQTRGCNAKILALVADSGKNELMGSQMKANQLGCGRTKEDSSQGLQSSFASRASGSAFNQRGSLLALQTVKQMSQTEQQ